MTTYITEEAERVREYPETDQEGQIIEIPNWYIKNHSGTKEVILSDEEGRQFSELPIPLSGDVALADIETDDTINILIGWLVGKGYLKLVSTTSVANPLLTKIEGLEPLENNVEAILGNRRITLTYIEESLNGDYDPENPKDTPLLRMDIDELDDDSHEEGGWAQIRDGSFCTSIDARIQPEEALAIAQKTAEFLKDFPIGETIASVELLSWIQSKNDIGTLITKNQHGLLAKQTEQVGAEA